MFDEAAAIVPALIPIEELGDVRVQPRTWGMKVWFGPARPPKQHYEAQVLGADADRSGTSKYLCIEVGFHTEVPKEDENDALLERIVAARRTWSTILGEEAEAGDFLGGSPKWRRFSETWPDPDLSDPELPFEIAARLTDYVLAVEPVLRKQ